MVVTLTAAIGTVGVATAATAAVERLSDPQAGMANLVWLFPVAAVTIGGFALGVHLGARWCRLPRREDTTALATLGFLAAIALATGAPPVGVWLGAAVALASPAAAIRLAGRSRTAPPTGEGPPAAWERSV